jgi:hypothetical protein
MAGDREAAPEVVNPQTNQRRVSIVFEPFLCHYGGP